MKNLSEESKVIKKGIALARVSTPGQASVYQGSLDQQGNRIMRFVQSLTDQDRDGIVYQLLEIIETDMSGREQSFEKRNDIQKAEILIRTNKIQFVIIEKLDRLGRWKAGNEWFVKLCHTYNVDLYEVDSGTRINLRDRGSRLAFNVKNMMAQEYSDELEEKITVKQREAMVNAGKDPSPRPILSLDKHPSKTGLYVINEAEQLIVENIFKEFCNLQSLKLTVEFCHAQRYRTKKYLTKERTDRHGNIVSPKESGGLLFTPESLRKHLTSAKIRGHNFFKDTWNQFPHLQDKNGIVRWKYSHDPVISEELFEEAQRILKKNAQAHSYKSNKRIFLLSGVLETSLGEKLRGASAKSGQALYYESKNRKIRISKQELENVVCARAKDYIKKSGILEVIITKSREQINEGEPRLLAETKTLRSKQRELQKIIENFTEKVTSLSLGSDVDKFANAIQALVEEKKNAGEDLSKIESQIQDLERQQIRINEVFQKETLSKCLMMVLEGFDGKSTHEKQKIIQAVFPKIVLDQDENKLELKVNPMFFDRCKLAEAKVRLRKNWLRRRDSNPRPSG